MCAAGFFEELTHLVASTQTHGFNLCFGFVTKIAKCFVFDIFPLNSDTVLRRMFESPFCGEKCSAVCLVFE